MQKVLEVFLILFGISLTIKMFLIAGRILLSVLFLFFSILASIFFILFLIGLVPAIAVRAVWKRFVKRGKAC